MEREMSEPSRRDPVRPGALAAEASSAGIEAAIGDCARYEHSLTGERGRAQVVLKPRNTEQVSRCLAFCERRRVPIVFQGANTGLAGAAVPDRTGRQAVLSLEHMSTIERLDARNRSILVQAGVRLSSLDRYLRDTGLFFPIDIGADATIGGMISTNAGGSMVVRYGDMRANVLGLEAVLVDGTVVDCLTSLRKNNVGLDVKQLFIGTGGAMGAVTRAVLNLSPRPLDTATALATFGDFTQAMGLLTFVERSAPEALRAFEGISGAALAHTIREFPPYTRLFGERLPAYCAIIEFGTAAPAGRVRTTLEEVLAQAHSEGLLETAMLGRGDELGRLRSAVPIGLQHSSERLLLFDVSVPRSRLAQFREELDGCLKRDHGAAWCDFGHLADGGLHIAVFAGERARLSPSASLGLRTALYDLAVREHGGSFSAEHGLGPLNQGFRHRYVPESALDASARVQQAFDPLGLLGRVRLGMPRATTPRTSAATTEGA